MAFQPREEIMTEDIGMKRKLSKFTEDDEDGDLLEDENAMNPTKRHTQSQRIKR